MYNNLGRQNFTKINLVFGEYNNTIKSLNEG